MKSPYGTIHSMDDNHVYMMMVLEEATRSPDPSTQNGAVLVNAFGPLPLTYAVNEFPRGVEYLSERWERPLKYSVIEHAERNAIYAAARNGHLTQGLHMVCPWAACSDCARAIIQAGIVELITLAPIDGDTPDRWGTSISIAMTMLEEAGVRVTYLPTSDFVGRVTPLLRDGKPYLEER